MYEPVAWPDGKTFAFSVFDDTDDSSLESGPDVYALLRSLGFKTTKSVWPIGGVQPAIIGGSTCEDLDYLAWVRELQAQGFEIALHGASYSSSPRAVALRGLEAFQDLFGHYPNIHVNHHLNQDSLYWGPSSTPL